MFNRQNFVEPSPYEADGGHSIGRDPRQIPLAEIRQMQHPESPIKAAIRAKCIDCGMNTTSVTQASPPAGVRPFPTPECRKSHPASSDASGGQTGPSAKRIGTGTLSPTDDFGAGTVTNVAEIRTGGGARFRIVRDSPRRAIEAEIDRLIALLDAADGDPEAEPALGWAIAEVHPDFSPFCAHVRDDREGGDILDVPHDAGWAEDIEAFEPSMSHPNGAHISGGGSGI